MAIRACAFTSLDEDDSPWVCEDVTFSKEDLRCHGSSPPETMKVKPLAVGGVLMEDVGDEAEEDDSAWTEVIPIAGNYTTSKVAGNQQKKSTSSIRSSHPQSSPPCSTPQSHDGLPAVNGCITGEEPNTNANAMRQAVSAPDLEGLLRESRSPIPSVLTDPDGRGGVAVGQQDELIDKDASSSTEEERDSNGKENPTQSQLLQTTIALDQNDDLEKSKLNCDPGNRFATMSPVSQTKKLRIIDARPLMNAKGNALMGKGHEVVARLGGEACTTLDFAGIANIHAMRESLAALRNLCCVNTSNPAWLQMLQDCKWLHHISLVLKASIRIALHLESGDPVLVHCSDGWDRTSQLCALSQLLIDPFYRTISGNL
jgi:hypothetical protein